MKLLTLAILCVTVTSSDKTEKDGLSNVRVYAIKVVNDDPKSRHLVNVHESKTPRLHARRRAISSDSSSESSSSRELDDWKDEWREMWLEKKFEAMNSTDANIYKGDVVNMAAARPWGVRCGDTDQHDVLWGTCMLPMECEPEYRIYRGDHYCGRTEFVCCAIETANYDMYHGFDATFEHSSLETDSQDKSDGNSRERRKRRRRREKKKRKRNRTQRKKKIKRTIKNIVKEIRKLLKRGKKNTTRDRKKKTKQLKKYYKHLKLLYKKDRDAMRDIHEQEMINIDKAFVNKLEEVVGVNERFMTNETFRKIVTQGLISKKIARELVVEFPELAEYLPMDKVNARRMHQDDYDFYED